MPDTLFFPKLTRRARYTNGRRYSDFRLEISEDCLSRCVYCDIHQNALGGYESMVIDHFQPQSKFPHLTNDPTNLVLACNRCNCLKRHDWHPIDPAQASIATKGYLDPFLVDRNDYFYVEQDGSLTAIMGPAQYIIGRLKLNRDFLIKMRRSRIHIRIIKVIIEDYFNNLVADTERLYDAGKIGKKECQKNIRDAERIKMAILGILSQLGEI